MTNLTRAHNELFRRTPDECFASLDALTEHCAQQKQLSEDRWHLPQDLVPSSDMTLGIAADGEFELNDWSFSQLCRLAGVSKETINRLSHKTASRALQETLPTGEKPMQLLTTESTVRAIHGVSYTRLWNADLLSLIREIATDFEPPPAGANGGTGLYCGQQDMFCFLIDPTCWAEIDGEAFAPGFYVWNSEVGRRSLGIQTFWFQSICRNHLIWDAVEVVDFTRKHTAGVHAGLDEIQRIIQSLVQKRDTRRDRFVDVVRKAMATRLGDDADEVAKVLTKQGLSRKLAKEAIAVAQEQGTFTIFSVVDAITRLTQTLRFAGDRVEIDQKAAGLLTLVA